MSLGQSLLPEFDHEMSNTRKTLERIPEEKFGWKPHERSYSMGELGSHIANLPGWATLTVASESFDTAPGGQPVKNRLAASLAELLSSFDQNVTAARQSISEATDEQLFGAWSLLANGRTVLTMPRVAVLRSFVMNHVIHHRAQLGVYLRLNDIAVPSIYGPSADEGGM